MFEFSIIVFVHEESTDYRFVYTIIESTQNIYTFVSKRKQCLSTLIAENEIWCDTTLWRDCVQVVVNMKIEDAN